MRVTAATAEPITWQTLDRHADGRIAAVIVLNTALSAIILAANRQGLPGAAAIGPLTPLVH